MRLRNLIIGPKLTHAAIERRLAGLFAIALGLSFLAVLLVVAAKLVTYLK